MQLLYISLHVVDILLNHLSVFLLPLLLFLQLMLSLVLLQVLPQIL